MAEFFKQLIAQLSTVWQKLSAQQKVVTASLIGFTALGLIGLMLWAKETPMDSGYKVLYSGLDTEDAAVITEKLKEEKTVYKIENNGRTIMVPQKSLYEVRMTLAREGLPKAHGFGYELFDKTNLGMTDFVQTMNAKRALQGELQRTIEGLSEVKAARVHVVIPEPSIFLEQQKEAKASVVIRTIPGRELNKEQIRGISYLLSSSVDGLKPQNVSIIDEQGKLLSSPYGDDQAALASSRNIELQINVENYMEKKVNTMLEGILGPGKSQVKMAVDLDFDQVEKNLENYNPESRVVRSEERSDDNVKNAPNGDRTQEKSLTNYEIDKTVSHVVQEVGNVKRLTISVVIDGRYDIEPKTGKRTYKARTAEEIAQLEDMIKNSVGYDLARGDMVSISSLQFDNEFIRQEQVDMQKQEMLEFWLMVGKYAALFIIVILFLFFLRYLAKTVAEAMNPPVPKVEMLGADEEIAFEIPERVKRSSEILERVEMLAHEEPVNISSIIRQWLMEPVAGASTKKKK